MFYFRFVRQPSYQPRSANPFVEIGRFFYNLITALFKIMNLIHMILNYINSTLSSLPFFVRYFVHIILTISFPFYKIYQIYLALANRIYQIIYPLYRAVTLLARILTFFIQLPVRIVTYLLTSLENLLKTLIILIIIVCLIFAISLIFLDDKQIDYMKSYFHNKTNQFFNDSFI